MSACGVRALPHGPRTIRQVLTYGARTPAADLVRQIESVTAADLNKVARALER